MDPTKPTNVDNIEMLHTFSGTMDEAWFYIIPLGVELAGAGALDSLLKIHDATQANETRLYTELLSKAKQHIDQMTLILKRMYEKNNPTVFWNQVRPYSGKFFHFPQQQVDQRTLLIFLLVYFTKELKIKMNTWLKDLLFLENVEHGVRTTGFKI